MDAGGMHGCLKMLEGYYIVIGHVLEHIVLVVRIVGIGRR